MESTDQQPETRALGAYSGEYSFDYFYFILRIVFPAVGLLATGVFMLTQIESMTIWGVLLLELILAFCLFLVYVTVLQNFLENYIFCGYKIFEHGFYYKSKPQKVIYWNNILFLRLSKTKSVSRLRDHWVDNKDDFIELFIILKDKKQKFMINNSVQCFRDAMISILSYAYPIIEKENIKNFLVGKTIDFGEVKLSIKYGIFYQDFNLPWINFDRYEMGKGGSFLNIYSKESLEPWNQIFFSSILNADVFIKIIETIIKSDKTLDDIIDKIAKNSN